MAIVSSVAFGGKSEREFIKENLNPAIAAAQKAYQEKCGCSLKITYNANIQTQNQLRLVRSTANSIAEGVKYCTDDASKKAVCQMKELEVTLDTSKPSSFTFKAPRGIASTDGQAYVTFDSMMTDQLDK